MGCGLALSPTALPAATALTPPTSLFVLLTWLLLVLLAWLLLALLTLSLALIGGGMHAGASAIGRGTGLVAIATHGGARLVTSEPAGAIIVSDRTLNPSVAADQAVIPVAATVRHIRPVPVIPVVGLIAGVVAVAIVVIPVSIVVVVIAVPVDFW